MSEQYYKGTMTLDDFRQMVKDLENDYEREQKRKNRKKDNSWAQLREIAKLNVKSMYRLDNGMFVTPLWCREYLKALDAWGENNFESKLILKSDK